jgi:hypothetical protein
LSILANSYLAPLEPRLTTLEPRLGEVLQFACDRKNCIEFRVRNFQPKLDAAMIGWRKLKFPDENATANELYTILSDFLREGLDATDAEEQKRLQQSLETHP